MIYFSSDHHFGHRNIIKFCKRPFTDVDHMDAMLIKYWNETVMPDDVVYYLGDFQISDDPDKYLPRLNGHKILIKGNHDYEHPAVLESDHWDEQHDALHTVINKTRVTLSHYAHLVWPGAGGGGRMLHGHSHGRLPGNSQRCDVGVDAWNYRPVSMSDCIKRQNKDSVKFFDPSRREQ